MNEYDILHGPVIIKRYNIFLTDDTIRTAIITYHIIVIINNYFKDRSLLACFS